VLFLVTHENTRKQFVTKLRADLNVVGPQATLKQYLVAGGTAIESGEPIHSLGVTYSSGTVDTNTFVLAAADTPVIG